MTSRMATDPGGDDVASCVARWLAPLAGAVPEVGGPGWERLQRFEEALRAVLAHPSTAPAVPAGAGRADTLDRARTLLGVRRHLATGHRIDTMSDPTSSATAAAEGQLHTLAQVVCGYLDLDLRDTAGIGHAALIARHARDSVRARWLPRVGAGELAGIAMTEAHGGSRMAGLSTTLIPAVDGGHSGYALIGRKRWVSRLHEASVWVVSATDTRAEPADGQPAVSAVVVDAAAEGLTRARAQPAGLSGWSWGDLIFDRVPVTAADVLGRPGAARALFEHHFTAYRPLVTATALGAAARAHDTIAARLAQRQRRGEIHRAHDHALIALGRTYAQLNAALLACLHTHRLATSAHPDAQIWGQTSKAHGIDLARHATDELIVFHGASGFDEDNHLQKIRRDLEALRYADGMHDSLYRAAGRTLLASDNTSPILGHGRGGAIMGDVANVPTSAHDPAQGRDGRAPYASQG